MKNRIIKITKKELINPDNIRDRWEEWWVTMKPADHTEPTTIRIPTEGNPLTTKRKVRNYIKRTYCQ